MLRELKVFTWREIQCSLFPLFLFAALGLTLLVPLPIARYDALFVLALGFQIYLLRSGIETAKEAITIAVFHVIGLGLEMYKVQHGSWTYPDDGFKIMGVPLYSGFMYASVASYMMQGWRRFEVTIRHFPTWPWLLLVSAAIYINFFSARLFGDVRWWIFGLVMAVFARSTIEFTTLPSKRRTMPTVVAFGLIGFFVWIAEHICTALRAWQYPYQREVWTWVDAGKLSSWILMVIISFCIVALLKREVSQGQAPAEFTVEPTYPG